MTKKAVRRRGVKKQKSASRQTNWLLIGGIILVGVAIVFGLLYMALQEPEPVDLANYCENNEGACVFLGDENAPVTMVEVSDLGCPHCNDFHHQSFQPLLDTFVSSGLVRWVALPYALSNTTLPAAAASMCANEQGAYFDFVQSMYDRFDGTNHLSRTSIDEVATEIGLDMTAFSNCVDSNRYVSQIQRNQSTARIAGVSGTPSFFVNGRMIEGNVPLAEFQTRIQAALEAANSGS